MLIKEEITKTNFIDENDLYVGFDTCQECCEYAGWFISDAHESYIGGAGKGPRTTEGVRDFDVEGYVLEGVLPSEIESDYLEDGNHLEFRLIKEGSKDLFLNIFNSHNGYYSHEVLMRRGKTVLLKSKV